MSYTIGIHSKEQIDGSVSLKALADTSNTFRDPSSEKQAEGFIQHEGRTCVGVVWFPHDLSEVRAINDKLKDSPQLNEGSFSVRELQLGRSPIGIVNILAPQPDIAWLAQVFEGSSSKSWILENTCWYPVFEGQSLLAPPRIVTQENSNPFVIFSVGRITNYFTGDYDDRGVQFREAHPDVHITNLPSVMFAEQFQQYGYTEGLRRLTTDEVTGMQHAYTTIYFDDRKDELRVAHMIHENSLRHWQMQTRDRVGNEIVLTGGVVAERFQSVWQIGIEQAFQNVEGLSIHTVGEQQRRRVERI